MTMRPGYGIPAWGDPGPPGGAGYLRASTADQERAIDVLKAGFAEGRLTKDEYDARISQAYEARTYGELAVVTADLPGGHLGQPAWPSAPARTNTLAIASLTCGVGQLFVGPVTTVPAIVLGHMARREIRRTGERGTGMATVGLVLGWTGFALVVLACLVIVLIVSAITRG
jgi:uncharacterized membrane protein